MKISEKYAINVYKFMEMCGLICERKGKTLLSHKAMLNKLSARYEMYSNEISIPKLVPFHKVKKEDIYNGTIVVVIDDYNKKLIYANPLRLRHEFYVLDEEEKEKVREHNIEEYLSESKKESVYKPGYLKYLAKKEKKLEKEREKELQKELMQSQIEDDYYNSMLERKTRVLKYPSKGFGRR